MKTKRNVFAFIAVVVIAISVSFIVHNNSDINRIFDKISDDMDFSYAQQILIENGFVSHVGFEKYIEDKDNLELQKEELNELLAFDEAIVYTKPGNNDVISFFNRCIVIAPTEAGKVKYKRIRYSNIDKNDVEQAKITFKKLTLGNDTKTVIKMMKKVADISSHSVEYSKDAVIETFEFVAFSDISFLSLVHTTYFSSEIVFVNGILSDGNYTCITESNSESENVVQTEYKYKIKN